MQIIIEAVVSFIGTNIDNVFVLVTLYLAVGSSYSKKDIVIGQMIGMSVLVIISYMMSVGTKILPTQFISLLGLLPILIGIKEGIKTFKKEEAFTDGINDSNIKDKNGLVKIVITAIACGADNVGVYIPLFSKYSFKEVVLFAIIFIVLIPVLCLITKSISDIPALHKKLSKHQKYLVPIVFILLGIYIIFK